MPDLQEPSEIWFVDHKQSLLQPVLYENDYQPTVIYNHNGETMSKPKPSLGFKLTPTKG